MAEKLHQYERYEDIEPSDERLTEKHETHEVHNRTPEKTHEDIERIEKEVERQNPVESNKLLQELKPVHEEHRAAPPNRELKIIALNNALSEIRSHLGSFSKSFSKVIHQPKINAISELSGKTVVRPTAILFGGLFMFVGSILYLYATYHTNARYNFFVAIFLFIGGFIAGIIIDLFYNLFFKSFKK
jgi:hypothetical protein